MKGQLVARKTVYSLLMLLISIILALLLAEIAIRTFLPQQEAMRWFQSDSKYGYILKSNFHQEYHYLNSNFIMDVKTNSKGHRYNEYVNSAFENKNIRKILLIGDSFTFGHGINIQDHFGVRLENLLNKSDSPSIVINTGVGGWGTLQATSYAKDNFARFNPDVIVYTFCENDPGDDLRFRYQLADNEKGAFYFPGKIFLRDHSHLYRFIYSKYHMILVNHLLRKQLPEQSEYDAEFNSQSENIATEMEWSQTLDHIESFYRDFLEINPRGLFFVQASASWNTDIREHLERISNGKSSIYVDLYDETILLSDEERRTPHDGHWSKRIHVISGDKLYDAIRKTNR